MLILGRIRGLGCINLHSNWDLGVRIDTISCLICSTVWCNRVRSACILLRGDCMNIADAVVIAVLVEAKVLELVGELLVLVVIATAVDLV